MLQTRPTGIILATQPDIHSSTWKIRPQRAHIYSRTHVSPLIKYDLRIFCFQTFWFTCVTEFHVHFNEFNVVSHISHKSRYLKECWQKLQTSILQKSMATVNCLVHSSNKCKQAWKAMRMSKLWQNFNFWVNCPFKNGRWVSENLDWISVSGW